MLLWVMAVEFENKAQFQGSEMSPWFFQDFIVFVPSVTPGNEDAGSAQDFISLFWLKSGALESRGSPRYPCTTSVVGSVSSDFLCAAISY